MFDCHGADHAGPLQGGVEDIVGADHGTGMGNCGTRSFHVPACLEHDNRFHACSDPQPAHETARIPHAFHVQENATGFRILRQVIQHIAEIDVRGIAHRHDRGKSYVVSNRPVEYRGAQRAGLGDQGEVPRFGGILAEGGVHAGHGTNQAKAIGAQDAHLILSGGFYCGLLQFRAVAIAFAEAGGDDNCGTHAVFAAGMDYFRNGRCRCGNHHEIDGLANRTDGRVTGMAMFIFRVDGIYGAAETVPGQIVENACADGIRPFAGAKHRDGLWREKTVEKMSPHIQLPVSLLYDYHVTLRRQ